MSAMQIVNHIVLGVIYNWFEGVLKHHSWFRWGFNGTPDASEKDLNEDDYYTTGNSNVIDAGAAATFWSNPIKRKLITAVGEVVVPTGVNWMPRRFGMSKNGKLKASEWHTLFSIHLPLAWVDMLIGRDIEKSLRRNGDTIQNLAALIQCTNIAPCQI
ncbi:hypothetical protein VP01_2872g7 [Puccinia sorghi]|uniref:Uncharacterized protein n=1 Tax=Puccinia sorghi TaxID=27349 RepID=A0A0L6V2K7_9BASI|nr:hypothetical protein VP01_2872g7 [Puccinia sorghi]